MTASATLHATAVRLAGRGILIRGKPGAGKSSLALELIDRPGQGLRGRSMTARLVADDQVKVQVKSGRVIMTAPVALAGRLEVRGIGIVAAPSVRQAALALVVDLEDTWPERMPEPDAMRTVVLGIAVPRLTLCSHDTRSAARLRIALDVV